MFVQKLRVKTYCYKVLTDSYTKAFIYTSCCRAYVYHFVDIRVHLSRSVIVIKLLVLGGIISCHVVPNN